MKICTKCGEQKFDGDFYYRQDTKRLRAHCKACWAKAHQAKYPFKDKEKHRKTCLKYLYKTKYGLSWEEYEELVAKQEHKCALCLKYTDALYVDHSHANGQTRELLCRNCNFGLGFFQDNPELMERAAEYIRRHDGR